MKSTEASDVPVSDEPAPVAIIRDPQTALAALRPPRPAILAALRQPDSASGLAPRLDLPHQKVYYHLQDLEKAGLVNLVEQRRRRGFTERVVQATAGPPFIPKSLSTKSLRPPAGFLETLIRGRMGCPPT